MQKSHICTFNNNFEAQRIPSLLDLKKSLFLKSKNEPKWIQIRDGPIGLGSKNEQHQSEIISITKPEETEYIATCSRNGEINFYRVLMYPNIYPYWTHLYYGKLTLPHDTIIKDCLFSKDQTQLIVLQSTKEEENNFNTVTILDLFEIIDVNTRDEYFISNPKINDHLQDLGFQINHPRDNVNFIWSDKKNIENSQISYDNDKYQKELNNKGHIFNNEKSINKILSNDIQTKQHNSFMNNDELVKNKIRMSKDSNYLIIMEGTDHWIIDGSSGNKHRSLRDVKDSQFSTISNSFYTIGTDNSLYVYSKNDESKKSNWAQEKINLEHELKNKNFQQFLVVKKNICDQNNNDDDNADYYNNNNNDKNNNIKKKHKSELLFLYNISKSNNRETLIIIEIDSNFKIKKIQEINLTNVLKEIRNGDHYGDDNTKLRNELLIKSSPDGKYVAVTAVGSNVIQILNYNSNLKKYIIHEQIILKSNKKNNDNENNNKISTINFYQFQFYYLQIGTLNGNYLIHKNNKEESPECFPLARRISFYIKERPIQPKRTHLYKHGNRRSNYIIDGIWKHPLFLLSILMFLILLYFQPIITKLEYLLFAGILNKIGNVMNNLKKYINYLPIILSFLSIFEIFTQQPIFVNDWPAHMSHIEQFLKEKTFDYSKYMHHHGPNTYASGWQYLYSIFYFITNSGSLTLFQILFAIFEVIIMILIFRIISKKLKLPLIIAILAIASNRLHLYNVRVLVNDFPSALGLYIVFYLFLNQKWFWASIFYSFVVATKLNFIFYSPVIFLILLHSTGIIKTILLCFVMLIEQIVLAIPFLLANPIDYLKNAYDISRTLLWEKSRNFKFVGLEIFDDSRWHVLLLCLTLIILVIFLKKVNALLKKIPVGSINWKRLIIFSLMFSNFIFITFSRGLYTPFFVWYFYSFSTICYFSGIPNLFILIFWISHEVLFRWWDSHILEMWITFFYFLINIYILISTFSNDNSFINILEKNPGSLAKDTNHDKLDQKRSKNINKEKKDK
ncbi:hypothetical protein M0812_02668 [Anaeramoeba flamelloides]|uniref:Dolichyl-phosphate-mannose--protein mannosyltransferase n=1 Tax=Anaeramoeba flamelloides TaxID=1746091 RepID=A0AAV7YMK3_9EUKA|nr:hypothetical protein M0812_02668 [Anaeramoeba flamelloides]